VRDTAKVIGVYELITNRKWHTSCQLRRKSLTLDDPEGHYALLWLNGARYDLGFYWSLIENCIGYTFFQMRWKSSTLNDLEGQYCNRNCIGCSVSSLATTGISCLQVFWCEICWQMNVPTHSLTTYNTLADVVCL